MSGNDEKQGVDLAVKLVEETIESLGVDPKTARIATAAGQAWSLMRGSAAMAIFVRPPRSHEDTAFLRVVSPIVHVSTGDEVALFRHLLELNAAGLGSVAFGLHEGRIVAVSERPTRDLDPGEVRYIVQMVGAVADHYDDELTKKFGGTRVSDSKA